VQGEIDEVSLSRRPIPKVLIPRHMLLIPIPYQVQRA